MFHSSELHNAEPGPRGADVDTDLMLHEIHDLNEGVTRNYVGILLEVS